MSRGSHVWRTESKRGFSVQEATSLKCSLKAQEPTADRQSAVSALPVTQQPGATVANGSLAALTQSLKNMPFSSLLALYRYDRDWHQFSCPPTFMASNRTNKLGYKARLCVSPSL